MIRLAIALLLAAAAFTAGCGSSGPGGDVDRLVIYSPHSDEIRDEFGAAFKRWYQAETGRPVEVDWPDAGGTSQIARRIQDKFSAGRYDVDLVFGGGPIYQRMTQLGFLEPYKLPEALLAAIPPTVAGQPLYDPGYHWYGAAISTFGLIYNKKLIAERGLPEVTEWSAMADPAYFGLVGAGDPSKSGSVRKAYEIILQAYGYGPGMAILVKMGANAREFSESASDIPRGVAQGFLAVGPAIDFYALRQMTAEGGENVGFVSPDGLTVVNTDPIGILKHAPHPEVAKAFVRFVMSPAGQRLWMLPAGTPGGPEKTSLQRLAVLPALYDEPGAVYSFNPFKAKPAHFYSADVEAARLAILPDYLRIALVENHEPLQRAWKALIDAGLPESKVRELTAPLISEEEMLRLGREVWTPVVTPEGVSPEEAEAMKREEEARLRRKSDLETAWSEQLRGRYQDLAAGN